MYLTEVAPLEKIPLSSSQVLSYFTSKKLKPGVLVIVPLQKRKVPGIVISQKKVEDAKLAIKKADFKLKPILKIIKKTPILSEEEIKLAFWISFYFWASLGKSLSLFLPRFLVKKIIKNPEEMKFLFKKRKEENHIFKKPKLYFFSAFSFPKTEMEKEIKKGKQILFLVPEKERESFWKEKFLSTFENIINENEICFFSGDITPKKYIELAKKIIEGKIKIILGTRSSLFLKFHKLGMIIVSEEENKNYKSEMEPRFHAVKVAEKLAKMKKIKLILFSFFPSLESYWKSRTSKYILLKEETKKALPQIKIIDMRKFKKDELLSEELLSQIKNEISQDKKVLLFLNQLGRGSCLFCQDCGWIKKCENCQISLLGIETKEEIVLFCPKCQKTFPIPTFCENCRSWRLKFLRKGIENLKKEIKEKIGNVKVEILSKSSFPPRKKPEVFFEKFFKNYNILLSTSFIFQYLHLLWQKFDFVGVVSLDFLLSFPDFKREEKSGSFLKRLSLFAKEKFYIQTFFPNAHAFLALKDSYEIFFEKEIKERKKYCYPPFSHLATINFPKTKKGEEKALLFIEKIKSIPLFKKICWQILGPVVDFSFKKPSLKVVLKLKKRDLYLESKIFSLLPSNVKTDVYPEKLTF